METPGTSPARPARAVACVIAVLPAPLALTVANLVAWHLKSTNPDGVDVTQGLAYLRPILLTGFGVLAALTAVAAVVAWRRARIGDRLPALLLAVHLAASALWIVTNAMAERAATS